MWESEPPMQSKILLYIIEKCYMQLLSICECTSAVVINTLFLWKGIIDALKFAFNQIKLDLLFWFWIYWNLNHFPLLTTRTPHSLHGPVTFEITPLKICNDICPNVVNGSAFFDIKHQLSTTEPWDTELRMVEQKFAMFASAGAGRVAALDVLRGLMPCHPLSGHVKNQSLAMGRI